jgi:hypothetical protein
VDVLRIFLPMIVLDEVLGYNCPFAKKCGRDLPSGNGAMVSIIVSNLQRQLPSQVPSLL